MATKKIRIAAFSGSLRKASYTTQLVKAFEKLAPEQFEFEIVDIGDVPMFNQDLEEDLPEAVKNLHKKIKEADAVLLATPEYNRSFPPVLKNALDWGSRPQGQNQWAKKPCAVVGCSPYSLGAFGAVNHLRQVITYVDMYIMQQPEFFLSMAGDKFNEKGELTDEDTIKIIKDFWTGFAQWIENFK